MKRIRILFLIGLSLLCANSLFGQETAVQNAPAPAAVETLDLETAKQIALADNPSMEAALARVEQAMARVEQAMAASWPSLNMVASAGRNRQSDTEYASSSAMASLFGQTADQTTERYGLGLQAAWTLFDGYYRSLSQELAKYGEQSAAESRQNARRLLASAVAEAFFNAQLARTQVNISEADAEFYSQQLRDVQNRYDVGAGPWGDVLNIKVQLNSAKSNLMLAKRRHEAALFGLAALLGIEDARLPETMKLAELDNDVSDDGVSETPDALIEEALYNRPDLKQLDLAVKSTETTVGMARSLYYPRVLVTGSINGGRLDDPGFSGDDFGNAVGLNLSWNLYNGKADQAKIVEAQQMHREANATLINLRNQITAEVRQGVTLLEAAREQVRLQTESVKLVEENRDLAKNEYESGEASLVRLNEAQRDLTRTYSLLAQSVVSFHQANQRLLTAVGRGE